MPRGKTWREKGGEVAMSWEPPVAPSPSLSLSASSSFDCPQFADIIDEKNEESFAVSGFNYLLAHSTST